jgi:hypothetical protein
MAGRNRRYAGVDATFSEPQPPWHSPLTSAKVPLNAHPKEKPVGGAAMPIRPFLANQAFDQDLISEMSTALQSVCQELGLKMIDDSATRLVAEKIIGLAQRGIRDASTLQAMAIKQLRH